MKYTILFLAMFVCIEANAQITLEETYPNAGYNGGVMSWQTLEIVRLEVDGDKFLFRDNENKKLKFYNLDHSLWKIISYSGATDVQPDYNNANILYVSQHLFDLDDEIEFMYVDVFQNLGVTQIVNEDDSFLFTADNQAPRLFASVPQNQQPINTTSEGTFMILSGTNSSDGNAYVYRLPGVLHVGIEEQVFSQQVFQSSMKAYPNPSKGEVRIEYNLPFGTHSILRITDELGRTVQSTQIPSHEGTYTLNAAGLGTGIYFCTLLNGTEVLATEKLVVQHE
jgi:hypothetical protein